MDKIEIKSKIYCPPSKKDRILFVAVNIAVVIVVIYSIVSIIIKGFNIGNISACTVAIVIAFIVRANNKLKGRYDFCILSIVFADEVLSVTYLPDFDKKVNITLSTINNMEYSDQLECLRLVCSCQVVNSNNEAFMEDAEIFLYIPYENNKDFYDRLEHDANQRLKFVDVH